MSERVLQVFGDLLELVNRRSIPFAQGCYRVFKAVVDMILDQRAFSLAHRLLNSMKLLGNVYTFTSFLDHGDDTAQMTISTL